jgi:hypothetical protein
MYPFQEYLQFYNFYVFYKLLKRSCEKFTILLILFLLKYIPHVVSLFYDATGSFDNLQPEVWIGSLKIVYLSHTDIQ